MKNKLFLIKPIIIIFVFIITIFSSYSQTDVRQEELFTVVDSMPEYPGGNNAMHAFISNNLIYPKKALKNKIEGKVYLNVIIETDGSVSNIKVLKGIGSGCEKEAVRLVSVMPKWKPGFHNGTKVRVSLTLPIGFKSPLKKEDIIHTKVDHPASYSGLGQKDFFINTNLIYPIGIIMNKIIDTIDVYFIVETDGSPTNVRLKNHKNEFNPYELEALRVVSKLPNCEPGYIKGKPVRTQVRTQVIFDYNDIDTSYTKTIGKIYYGKEFFYYKRKGINELDSMPEFPGGISELYKYLSKHIKYPIKAKMNGEQGKVYVNFVVEPDGSISNCRIIWGPSVSLNNEALRVIRNMPEWKPGIEKGEYVRVSFNLPIKFTLW